MDTANLTVIDVAKMLHKRWWALILAFIIGAGLFFSYNSYIVAPEYTSKGSLYVNNVRDKISENVNMSDMATSQMLVWTYIELLKSNTFTDKVAEVSELGYTGTDIRYMIKMEPKNETEIMEIAVTAKNPEHAQIIVNTILDNAPEEIDRVIQGGSVVIIDRASYPTEPSGPNVLFNTIIGAIVMTALAAAVIVLLEIIDNRVKDEDELVKLYELPVLGAIPDMN